MPSEISGVSPLSAVAPPQVARVVRAEGGGVDRTANNVVQLAGPSGRPALLSSYSSLQGARDQQLDAAQQVRAAGVVLQKSDELLAQIKERLTHIVKQYPPFSQDSPQRITYLNSISGLRKQLDALAFPPERKAQQAETASLGLPSVPGPSLPAKGDLAIPELDPRKATDEEVRSALDAVVAAQARVTEAQDSMWDAVVRFVGDDNLAPASDSRVQNQADSVRSYVAANPGQVLGFDLHHALAANL